jgi:diaminopropionate ammonia-lyase
MLQLFAEEEIASILKFQKTHALYRQTPFVSLSHLAEYIGVGEIRLKDESQRFGLNAFKVMGGIYAIGKYIANTLDKNIEELSFSELQSEEVKQQLGDLTFISATDGNHGRGVAWAAKELGQQSVIYLPKGSSQERLDAIRNAGAKAEITDVNYDETVEMCARLAEENGWVLVQDTAWEGYEAIPQWIMQGYASIAKEMADQAEKEHALPPTHVILQAGVGSFAAGIAAYFIRRYGEKAPKIVLAEPDQADCYFRSFSDEEGRMRTVTGDMNSMMAGLNCGVPNTQAFELLKHHASGAFSCPDWVAGLGMRVLGNPLAGDARIISGESGAVPLGLLYHLAVSERSDAWTELGFGTDSRVWLISTEGDTDAENYRRVVWLKDR